MTPPAAAATAAAPGVRRGRVAAPPRPRVSPPRPRRISGPVRQPARQPAGHASQPAQADGGLVLGLLALGRALSSHTALDRLIRGRIWIALIAFALIGIVTLQLLVLQLNAGIGRALVREAQLQRTNAAYSVENSELASGERVESQAAQLGMELVPVGALRFLGSNPQADIARAAAALGTPVASTEATAPAAATAGSSASGEASSTAGEQSAAAAAPASPSAPTSSLPSATAGAATTGEAASVGAAGGVGATAASGAG